MNIVLLHGLFGFKSQQFRPILVDFFLGVPEALRARGHKVFTPGVNPVGSVTQRAQQLAQQLQPVLAGLPADEKIVLVAYSMGGLDARQLLSNAPSSLTSRVAALVTVASPHRGSPVADLLVKLGQTVKLPTFTGPLDKAREAVAGFLKTKLLPAGVAWPDWADWLGGDADAVPDLTTSFFAQFNARTANVPGIGYYWVATDTSMSVPLLLELTHRIVFGDAGPSGGPNDGVVAVRSAQPPDETGTGNPWIGLGTWPVDHLNAANMRLPGEMKKPDVAPWYVALLERIQADLVR